MKFLANENIPLETCANLRDRGVEILSVRELSPGAKDEAVIKLARKEGSILIAFDKDFGEFAFKKRLKPRGIILLRFPPRSPKFIADKLRQLLSMQEVELEEHFTIVREQKIRSVPLTKEK